MQDGGHIQGRQVASQQNKRARKAPPSHGSIHIACISPAAANEPLLGVLPRAASPCTTARQDSDVTHAMLPLMDACPPAMLHAVCLCAMLKATSTSVPLTASMQMAGWHTQQSTWIATGPFHHNAAVSLAAIPPVSSTRQDQPGPTNEATFLGAGTCTA